MRILLISDYDADPAYWTEALTSRIESAEICFWPQVDDPDGVEIIIIDTHMRDKGGFSAYGNLKWVSYLGHGVADVLLDPSLPDGVQVTRLRDEGLAKSMTIAAVHAVLAHHSGARAFARLQARGAWKRVERIPLSQYRVAVLGLGTIGTKTAEAFPALGYAVTGWSRSPKSLPGVTCRHGMASLDRVLSDSDAVVALLPETPETIDLFDRDRLQSMKPGSLLVNLGRGSLIVEDDLIAALDNGTPGHAALDVFRTEPLPQGSPLWGHPHITVTPHAGGPDTDGSPIEEIVENHRRLAAGEPLINLADRQKGY